MKHLRKKSRTLLFVLSLCLVLGMMPTMSFAAGHLQLAVNQAYTATAPGTGSEMFDFTAPHKGKLTVELLSGANTSNDYCYTLYQVQPNGALRQLWSEYNYGGSPTSNDQYLWYSPSWRVPAGNYCLKANYDFRGTEDQSYSLTAQFKSEGTGYESEWNGTMATANPIGVNKTYTGSFNSWNDVDYYKVTIKKTGYLAPRGSGNSGWPFYCGLYKLTKSNSLKGIKSLTIGKGIRKHKVKVTAGTYYFRLSDVDRGTDYHFKAGFTLTPSKVKITAMKGGNKQITLCWKKAAGADGYIIYRAAYQNGKYIKIKTISKATTLKYVNKKLWRGAKYSYKVRSYQKVNGHKVYGPYSKIRSVRAK